MIVDAVRLAVEVGENDAVALIRGVTQVLRVGSEFKVVRKVEHEEVMLAGIKVCRPRRQYL